MNELQFSKKNLAAFQQLAELSKAKKSLEEQEKELKEKLQTAMEKHGITSIDNDVIKISYVAASESVSLDTKALLAAEPKLYHKLEDKYNKRTVRKPYLRFAAK